MTGKIIKGIAGFYYVHVVESGVYECKAKGIFRKDHIKPLIGDNVEIQVLDEENKEGNIIEILPRQNELIRPNVSNIDQALVVFAVARPKPHFNLLDRFLVMMEYKEIPTILCFNKEDIAKEGRLDELKEVYEECGYPVLFTSAKEKRHMDDLMKVLKGKTTVIAGPSGVGKSSLLNVLFPEANMETGAISEKIERGKHTTRHSELFSLGEDTFIMDTPGFSSLFVMEMEKEELKYCYPEFESYNGTCKFSTCDHIMEPGCRVKQAVDEEMISKIRYGNYVDIYNEVKNRKRY
ncbi:ribosome biogenesis GTPase [Aequitasia blattaphilus]|uniref:Small ribosomal subunit biogenesis GTPase RsgA n=1 Tax=Aequitasia blattaphilus TaxID=2949332 RepID=A0ABT1EA83_9FIRM|nr:ribosome small subunit-dependent GTPase A [Aequitasia blattaphilus]MCP1102745.1 ribosome small subunit-dependent GTPase A [Aequitasia blattaphilus]MCR8615385.1 ribosome small subunit-dependent GTPase A [Aequitasia blattaphilus]